MDDLQIDSQAFRKALLASERRRIYGVIAFLLVFAIAIAARIPSARNGTIEVRPIVVRGKVAQA